MNIQPHTISIKEYDYSLPHEKIAEFPLARRDQSKLLIYKNGVIQDDHFYNIAQKLPQNSTLVLNNTRVIEARLLFQKPTGGVIEIFCLEPHDQPVEQALQTTAIVRWECLIGGASKWKPGQILEKHINIHNNPCTIRAKYVGKLKDSFIIEFFWEPEMVPFVEVLHAAGAIPLPPYIKRKPTNEDAERYQTVFSKQEGSVAAPTAALHFTKELFQELSEKKIFTSYITLHVGAGTFKPVKTETIADHEMHREPFTISRDTLQQLLNSDTIIAVGTTSLRTLESLHWLGVKWMNNQINDQWELHQWEAYELLEKYPSIDHKQSLKALLSWMDENDQNELHCQTSLIIVPGYQFQIPKALITNFHQPQSTLLLLVSAFIGNDWKKVYQHALNNNYRFLSYGDSSLLWRG
jgi:S-adenosylmethionine:tRNA ribosyltransferase-isomerase